jgi:hypothetical protein
MTKNFFKSIYRSGGNFELLSAYLDNELSDEEIKKLEEELQFSKELQEKLAELKRIKELTTSSVKPLEENPFFETRLAASLKIKNPWYYRFKRITPVYGIIALCIALMIVLKYNPNIIDAIIYQQKSNITAFYKQNLKPLLYTADLTNEDIFDFAFYHQLPLDSQKKQYLLLGSDKNGKQYFEIKESGNTQNGNNLEKFVKNLNLNGIQHHQVDSILSSYANDLQAQVLVNEKNIVAINPNIWNCNKAIALDLISFAQKINNKESREIVPPGYDRIASSNALAQLCKNFKSAQNNKYIFLTSDSIFSDQYQFNGRDFDKEMENWSAEMNKNLKQLDNQFKKFNVNIHFGGNFAKLQKSSSRNKGFNVFIDSNSCRVDIPEIVIPQVVLPDMGNLSGKIDSLMKYIGSLSFEWPNPGKNKNFNYKYFFNDSSKGYNFNYKAFGFDSSFISGNRRADEMLKKRFKNFNTNPDSIVSFYRMFMGDSSNGFEIRKQMKNFEKQMEQFQKQMEQLQKQLRKNIPEGEQKKPVEI